jgi:hypothetical protein
MVTFLFSVAKIHRAVEDANRARGLSRRIVTLDLMNRYARSQILLGRCHVTAFSDVFVILTDRRNEGLTKTTRTTSASELIVKMSELTHSFNKRQRLDRAILRSAEVERNLARDTAIQLADGQRRGRCEMYYRAIDATCGEIGSADDGAYKAVDALYGRYGKNQCTQLHTP